VGLDQGLELARIIHETIEEDQDSVVKCPIVVVVDVPSQAYGYKEEFYGLSFTCAASVEAYAQARMAGHPVITVIVKNAISGAFLAQGLQGSYFIALDDDQVTVHAMSKKSAAKITKRSTDDLASAADAVPAIAYDIHSFNCLGAVRELLKLKNHDHPDETDVKAMSEAIIRGIADSRAHKNTLDNRLETENAKEWRKLTINIKKQMSENWN
jgi:malonate decarboxylase beta subunit